ncbi:biotin--[acetyl-CoA-carboxylase] ligase [Oleidesulfovibrio sp.]|uniref:biotin--[acetyl-CoA-carboxylase] ligase n=1 Tax=Oleidesulfovibrio sp. TaxID=2909707 RepID=UPI003A8AF712
MSEPVYIVPVCDGKVVDADPADVADAIAASHPLWHAEIAQLGTLRLENVNGVRMLAVDGKVECGPVFICGDVSSSLDVAHSLHSFELLPEWGSVLAVSQSSGRGQMRRDWSSPAGNIYAVLRLPVASGYPDSLSSLVVAYCFARAFGSLGLEVRIKWPNDLLHSDRKFGGILLEDRAGALFAGIGINLAYRPDDTMLRKDAAVSACALEECGFHGAPLQLWRKLVERAFFCYYNEVLRFSEDGLISRLEAYLAWVGRVVNVHGSDFGNCPGRLMGLSHDGALRVLLSGREQVLHSCSLSLTS